MNQQYIDNAAKTKLLSLKFGSGASVFSPDNIIFANNKHVVPNDVTDWMYCRITSEETENYALTDQRHKSSGAINYTVCIPINTTTARAKHIASLILSAHSITKGPESYLQREDGGILRVVKRRQMPGENIDNEYCVTVQVEYDTDDA